MREELVQVNEPVIVADAVTGARSVQVAAADEPRRPPDCAFSRWLFAQQHRQDQVGQLAHVVARDPLWKGADTRAQAVAHLTGLGANRGLQRLMGLVYDEWARIAAKPRARQLARAKGKQQKRARKRQR